MIAHNPMAKAKRDPKSLRLAINAHCYMCMGGSETDLRTANSVLSLVKGCTSELCPANHIPSLNTNHLEAKTKTDSTDTQVDRPCDDCPLNFDWLSELSVLSLKHSDLGITHDLAGLTIVELRGLYAFLKGLE